MSVNQEEPSRRLKSCLFAMGWLLLFVAVTTSLLGYFGFQEHGGDGLNAALLAGAICFGSASAALVVTAMTAGSPNALAGSFLGIFLRTALPFFVSILLVQASKPLADAGLFGMVLISYLVVLAVETVLAVRIVQAHSIDGGSAVNG